MRSAIPWMLQSGEWGAWLTGEDVKPDMLICVPTCNGKSVPSRVKRVVSQSALGAICETIDVSVEDNINLEISFLDQVKPNDVMEDSLFGWLRKWACYQVEDAIGPAPVIDRYEYYEDFEIECELYELDAQYIIEELGQTLLSLQLQTTQDSLGGNNRSEGVFILGEASPVEEDQGNVIKPAPHKLQLNSSQPIWSMSYLPKT